MSKEFDDELDFLSTTTQLCNSSAVTNHDVSSIDTELPVDIAISDQSDFQNTFSIDDNIVSSLTSNRVISATDDILSEILSVSHVNQDELVENKIAALKDSSNSDDFMSWLSDINETPAKENNDVNNIRAAAMIPHTPLSSGSTCSAGKLESMDDFFDEVFGNSTPVPPSVDLTLSGTKTSVRQSPERKHETKTFSSNLHLDLMGAIEAIVDSNFPNTDKLKDIIIKQLGYIPEQYRGQIWNLLLVGQTQGDLEISSYSPQSHELPILIQIGKDCDAIISKYTTQNEIIPHIDLLEKRQNMSKILMLYCTRRQVEYSDKLTYMLSPMLFCEKSLPIPIASSCFYNFASSFVPFLHLKQKEAEDGLVVVHTWLRLLVNYHSPVLVQYLDKVLPGWEQPKLDNTNKDDEVEKVTSEEGDPLDDLDRELGLTISTSAATTSTEEGSDNVENKTLLRNESDMKMIRLKTRSGAIPKSFICGMFTSSLPPQQAVILLDWAILYHEKYTAVYCTAALLEIFSSDLLTLSGDEIRSWLDDVAIGKKDWFKFKAGTNDSGFHSKLSWEKFVNGWVYAASALKLSTPIGLQQALSETETWIHNRMKQNIARNVNEKNSNSKLKPSQADHIDNGASYLEEEDDDIRGSDVKPSILPPTKQNFQPAIDAGSFLDKFLNMETPITSPSSSSTSALKSQNAVARDLKNEISGIDVISKYKLKSHHDTKSDDTTMSLWSIPEEVIPCLCSNRRRPCNSESVLTYFQLGINASTDTFDINSSNVQQALMATKRGYKGVSFPLNPEFYPDLKPFYFGIDCRPEHERSVGHFPKAYIVESSFTSDSDEISALLETLKPLASSVHLCIIGSGFEYFEAKHKNSSLQNLNDEIKEYEAKLNSIIVFFQKKAFKHVSFLDGGFCSAARYLRRPDTSIDISQALVDANVNEIDVILSIPTSKSNELSVTAVASLGATVSPVVEKTKQLFGGIGQRFASLSIWNNNVTSPKAILSSSTEKKVMSANQSISSADKRITFVIADDDEEHENDHDHDPEQNSSSAVIPIVDSNTISILRTDQQRQQALAMHKLSGLKRGDTIVLSKENLPGAVLFPAIVCTEDKTLTSDHRFLAVTRERFIVLDSGGKGVGANATVISNNHLTELQKMTFRKRDPEFITLFFLTAGVMAANDTDDISEEMNAAKASAKTQQYRISKRMEFIEVLQKNMMRFK